MTKTKPTILVTSGAGNTGRPVTQSLLQAGFPVRAMVRREDERARKLRELGADVVVGNLFDVRDLRSAMRGVQRAYFVAPHGPNGLHASMAFAVAAQEAKLETVTTLSQWLSHPGHPSLATRELWLADQISPWMPNVDVVQITPGWFAWTYFLVLDVIAQLGVFPMALGQGRNAPPSNEDMGAVVAATLVDPAPHVGKAYRPTGPKLLTPEEIAATFARVLGRDVKYAPSSVDMFVKAATVAGFPAHDISQVRLYFTDYQQDAFALGAPTTVVRELTGREAEDFETICRRYVEQRPEAIPTLGNKMAALGRLLRAMLMRTPDMDFFAREQNHPPLSDAVFAKGSQEWRSSHQLHANG
ncbi:MAG: NmrA family NAD(P)-binding protein [Deltaproteobacteria bacterium]|nr:NmrA family NAD(P)-binding protein [Deltaproteobacteria bacterium]NND28378.1 NmrA family NAD(P)-binding protein [Myxococcales bacterium]MBT8465964.1 NmrA family NAD(P)-binding protein [Deltaproteobacteria bacterium]MBT8482297.1 NmrA family NAD(P)-binding protein [Deltaproteobacteria bacterium]NNK05754.1 NmrA family NAD(P)-binding protein [Myxococcales bacterium]